MKVRFYIGIAVLIVLLMVGIGSARILQVNAANLQGGSPGEAWVLDYISTDPDAGYHVSMVIDQDHDNTPWIAYHNETDGSLMVAHYVGAGDGNCNANDAWLCEQVDHVSGESKGLYTSIAIHPDTNTDPFITTWRVGVSYYDASYSTLKYAQYRCTFIGTCEWTIQTVDISFGDTDITGKFTSLKLGSDATPQISYYAYDDMGDFRLEMLRYAYYVGDGSGDCGDFNDWVCQTVDSSFVATAVNYGGYSSLDLDDEDRAYISFYDGNLGDLKLAYYYGFGGACVNTAWQCEVVDDGDGGDVGLFTSIHAKKNTEDMMRIAYYDKTAGELRHAYSIGSSGNCGPGGTTWQCNTIDTIGTDLTQLSISLAVDGDNQPMIAYFDDDGLQEPLLKVASPAYFASYANCGGDILFDWWCRSVDEGNWDLRVADYAALGIKSNGMAVIAYSEYDNRFGEEEMHLKFAYQAFESMLPLVSK